MLQQASRRSAKKAAPAAKKAAPAKKAAGKKVTLRGELIKVGLTSASRGRQRIRGILSYP
jgi:hypothetical protein